MALLIGAFVGPNDPPIASRTRALKYIGPMIGGRLARAGVTTLQQLIDRLERHTRAQNRDWMRAIAQNARSQECVDSVRGALFGRAGNNYSVNPVNMFAYNAMLVYARAHMSRRTASRVLPRRIPPRRPASAFPDRCPR